MKYFKFAVAAFLVSALGFIMSAQAEAEPPSAAADAMRAAREELYRIDWPSPPTAGYRVQLEKALAHYRLAAELLPYNTDILHEEARLLDLLALWAESAEEKQNLRTQALEKKQQRLRLLNQGAFKESPDGESGESGYQIRLPEGEALFQEVKRTEDVKEKLKLMESADKAYRKALAGLSAADDENAATQSDLFLEWSVQLLELADTEQQAAVKQDAVAKALEIYKNIDLVSDAPGRDQFVFLVGDWLTVSPDEKSRRMWRRLISTVFERRLKSVGKEAREWRLFGIFLYDCAFSEPEGKNRDKLLSSAEQKYKQFVSLSPDKTRAKLIWALDLSFMFPKNSVITRKTAEYRQEEKQALLAAQDLFKQVAEEKQEPAKVLSLLRDNTVRLLSLANTKDEYAGLLAQADLYQSSLIDLVDDETRGRETAVWGSRLTKQYEAISLMQQMDLLPEHHQKKLAERIIKAFSDSLPLVAHDSGSLQMIANDVFYISETVEDFQLRAKAQLLVSKILEKLSTGQAGQRPSYKFAAGLNAAARCQPHAKYSLGAESGRSALSKISQIYMEAFDALSETEPGDPDFNMAVQSYFKESPFPTSSFSQSAKNTFNRNTLLPLSHNLMSTTEKSSRMDDLNSFQQIAADPILFHLSRLDDYLTRDQGHVKPLMHMAGLYRYVAASSYVPKDDQIVYWRRATDLLAQAETLARQELEHADPSGQKRDKRELALVLSEKGLVLAEMAMAFRDDITQPLPPEVFSLWAEADHIYPGMSVYSRARLAAWENDIDGCRVFLRHTPHDKVQKKFPAFDQARRDPAFADVKDRAWFKKAWFGYGL